MKSGRCVRRGSRRAGALPGLGMIVTLCTTAVFASNGQAFTIDDAMGLAISDHPGAKAARLEAKAAEREVGAARSGYFPTVSLDGSIRRENTDRPTFERTLTAKEYSLTVTQPIFDGMRTPARVSAAKADAEAETLTAQSKLNDVAFDAADAYLSVLEARQRLALLKDHEKRARNIADRIERRAKADPGLRSLTVVGSSQTEEARYLVMNAERELVLAETRYRELIGAAPDALEPPVEPVEIVDLTPDEAVAGAERHHPALAAARARALAADGSHDAAKASFYPRLDAEARARNGRNIEGISGPDDDYYVGLRLTYNFATGGAAFYDASAARYREQAASIRIHDVARDVRLGVLKALENYRSARDTYQVLLRRKAAASELVRVYDAQFIGGQRDLLDLFFVLNEERAANRAELDARFDKLRSAYGVVAAMGELAPAAASGDD
ncbi:adhesin transport system outer membrane protein [Parvibaculum indicum]|uniref:TolC family outer membrane protein n=1 Tax=Parvibaculum indicum TaxID=562969 RepID=UPI001423BA88|nr:TolC family outer membrane protein [Parvibaculum indicum]NIJ42559.1 adhesin transport system outer membrane protein [Parvibaculum indicum]